MDIRPKDRRGFRLWFPVILIWIFVAALLILLLPLMLIAALVSMDRGPGVRLLAVYPAFFGIVFALSGLRIDVSSRKRDTVFISFD
jgi:hypothetical protein